MQEALKKIAGGNYDVLISDIGLSDGNGWDLIREMGAWRPPFAIAMSGYGTAADRERSVGGWLSPSLDKTGILGEISRRARRGSHGSTRPLEIAFAVGGSSSRKERLLSRCFLWPASVSGAGRLPPRAHYEKHIFMQCPNRHSSC